MRVLPEKLFDIPYIPRFDLLAPQVLYRVRHSRASAGTVKMDCRLPLLLPPSYLMSGRLDVAAQPDAYFAERPEMTVYEGICRREATGASMALMSKRSLPVFRPRPKSTCWIWSRIPRSGPFFRCCDLTGPRPWLQRLLQLCGCRVPVGASVRRGLFRALG